MPLTNSRRNYRSRRRKAQRMGGIVRSRYRYPRKPMTTGKVKRIVGAELKERVFGSGFINFSLAAPNIFNITSGIALGDTSTTRTGNWIKPIVFHGYITIKGFNGAASDQTGVRISIIRWNEDQANNAITAGKVFEDQGAPFGPFNIVNTGAFKVVWTRAFQVINDVTNPKFLQTRKFYVRLSGAPKITYSGGTAKKYQYHFLFTTNDLSAAENPGFLIDGVFRFTDS